MDIEQSDNETTKVQESQSPTPNNSTTSVNQRYHWPAELTFPKTVKYVLKPEKIEVLKKMGTYKEWKQAFVAYSSELGKEDKFGNVLAHSRCIKDQVFKTIEFQVGKGNIETTTWPRLRKVIKSLYGNDVKQIDVLSKAESIKEMLNLATKCNDTNSSKWIDEVQFKINGVICNFFAKGENYKEQAKDLENSFQELGKAILYAVAPDAIKDEAKQILLQVGYEKELAATYANSLRDIWTRHSVKKSKSSNGPMRTTSVAPTTSPYPKRANVKLREVSKEIYDERKKAGKCLNCGSPSHKVDKCTNATVKH